MRSINPSLFKLIQASLKRHYLMMGQPISPVTIKRDSSLQMFNPQTIERTMRVMAERGMVERPKKGLYKPKYESRLEFERTKTLEEFI